jgi:hypothetical protein
MVIMDRTKKEQLIQALNKKGANQPCSRCSSLEFELVGQTTLPMNDNPKIFPLGGPVMPFAIVACLNCGFSTLHIVGLLERITESTDEK